MNMQKATFSISLATLCLVVVLLVVVLRRESQNSNKPAFQELLDLLRQPHTLDSSAKNKVVATQIQIDNYKTALGVYELDNGVFPSSEQGLQALITQPSGAALPNWKGPYLDQIRPDPWGHAYIYKYPGVKIPNGFDLYSTGPNGIEGDDDDIGNWQ